ncbi:hypothetical protein NQ317_007900 [Molorchus minor]|uniref:Uncharacterized protein n=1 Tax=Molorchus minor TaxID=1323400 RepID=A0ABQ9JV21_9CUCU|nr:hypothetical protein NQ317_007900 [Molorchus minor]
MAFFSTSVGVLITFFSSSVAVPELYKRNLQKQQSVLEEMEQFFPALAFNITEEPVVCKLCAQSVNSYFSLAETCRLTEGR